MVDGGGKEGDGEQDGGAADAGEQDGGQGQANSTPAEPPKQVDRQEAERLLDSVRRNEKNFLMNQKLSKGKKRPPPEKDW